MVIRLQVMDARTREKKRERERKEGKGDEVD